MIYNFRKEKKDYKKTLDELFRTAFNLWGLNREELRGARGKIELSSARNILMFSLKEKGVPPDIVAAQLGRKNHRTFEYVIKRHSILMDQNIDYNENFRAFDTLFNENLKGMTNGFESTNSNKVCPGGIIGRHTVCKDKLQNKEVL